MDTESLKFDNTNSFAINYISMGPGFNLPTCQHLSIFHFPPNPTPLPLMLWHHACMVPIPNVKLVSLLSVYRYVSWVLYCLLWIQAVPLNIITSITLKQLCVQTRTQSFQYRRDFDTFQGLRTLLELKSQKGYTDYTGPYGTIRDHKGPYGTIRDHTGPYRNTRDYTGPKGTIRNHKGP